MVIPVCQLPMSEVSPSRKSMVHVRYNHYGSSPIFPPVILFCCGMQIKGFDFEWDFIGCARILPSQGKIMYL